jgi:hypothetical protein
MATVDSILHFYIADYFYPQRSSNRIRSLMSRQGSPQSVLPYQISWTLLRLETVLKETSWLEYFWKANGQEGDEGAKFERCCRSAKRCFCADVLCA